jgi:membrane associated rhomboid family serine protease
MFLLLPVRVRAPEAPVPLANPVLIAVSVLVYLFVPSAAQRLAVGPGSPPFTVLSYGFVHADAGHLLLNLWALWLFGNPVNRRLGDTYYLLSYLGALLTLGVVVRLVASRPLVGPSGALFAVLLLFFLLLPRARVQLGYVALFPLTLLAGLIARPAHWLFWLVRWGSFALPGWAELLLVPLLEVAGLWASGWNWTNLAHLCGLACGAVAALLLPPAITMPRRRPAAARAPFLHT